MSLINRIRYILNFVYTIIFYLLKNKLLELGPRISNLFFNDSILKGFKVFYLACLNLHHLNAYTFQHIFWSWIKPLFSCLLENESVTNSFLRCHHDTNIRITLLNDFNQIEENNIQFADDNIVKTTWFDKYYKLWQWKKSKSIDSFSKSYFETQTIWWSLFTKAIILFNHLVRFLLDWLT